MKKGLLTAGMAVSLFLLLFTTDCLATTDVANDQFGDEATYYGDAYDPLEPINRGTFGFNDKYLYRPVFFPVNDAWNEHVHDDIKTGITNIFHCASTPVRVAGDLIQLEGEKAIIDLFSLFNVFTLCTVDIYKEDDNFDDEDVSQGLASLGIPEGPVIVWPFFGPSNIRNTVGAIADTFLKPQTYLGFPAVALIAASEAINNPEPKNSYRTFEELSVDQYSSVRDGFRTNFNKKLEK